MKENNIPLDSKNIMPEWITIKEAIKITNKLIKTSLTESDIYRHAMCGHIRLSIYFQSQVILQKIKTRNHKIKFRPIETSVTQRLCLLERNCFMSGRNLIISTEGNYIYPVQKIIDTSLAGYEYILIQNMLAKSLRIPLPVAGMNNINYGITVTISGELFKVFERISWNERIKQQTSLLPENIIPDINEHNVEQKMNKCRRKGYFPIHALPPDACFVIRYSELEKLINMSFDIPTPEASSTRISTPLSRLFWLACKHNDAISPLIEKPYKLLSIFEQWASADGITDRLSGDTLKTALNRGSPSPTSSSN
ncbi:hypothetical protein ED28_05720 [[Pantoea] beijingensis]|uniref:Uncharacterized protein n=1 Tax=[Pantoea] beijingensis TaxID=1324864 RepID=A0A443IFL1_9GAMM|nr:hypothetical protein [[Pantoea] beijingensis]RWR02820.1 hypothetical protein ED28_05720 [[Pantoea] beijingensis]